MTEPIGEVALSEKSFERYIHLGYQYATSKNLSPKELNLLKGVSDIDTSIIKIDDILDNDFQRNGKPTAHTIDGVEKTIVNAKLDEINGVENLTKLIEIKREFPAFNYEILKVFNNKYMRGIYEGQKIDLQLASLPYDTPEILDLYFTMARKFTGGHIRYGLEIGQLLGGKVPETAISTIALLLGINRQIIDDFDDYFKIHHNPFGDITRGIKRIPEILFMQNGGNRERVLELLQEKKFSDVITIVLTPTVREKLFRFCEENIEACKTFETNFDYSSLIIDYDKILSQKI